MARKRRKGWWRKIRGVDGGTRFEMRYERSKRGRRTAMRRGSLRLMVQTRIDAAKRKIMAGEGPGGLRALAQIFEDYRL
jgi:hypothetical protein